jgi:hypothetical protein
MRHYAAGNVLSRFRLYRWLKGGTWTLIYMRSVTGMEGDHYTWTDMENPFSTVLYSEPQDERARTEDNPSWPWT